ncbi:glycosyltransferase family 4 protein [uncultured Cohaesibacter sp.]|uniref:glycosyltransferase family 4 protein n=1 Tax=uncultured Cohaesibacter sp. TaxID=1002546 RepID=UPI0029C60F21|nr:glycosyltransferase family 4 protein [uncultured Cohaesibacter sp.]
MTRRPRILFMQTQAENAGAQEITRLLAAGLEPMGYDAHQLFFYRKTDAFDQEPKTIITCHDRPGQPLAFAGFLVKLVRQIRELQPDVVLTFQHYGNIIGAPASRIAGVRHIIANQVSAPAMMNGAIQFVDKQFGRFGLYDKVTVNTADTAKEYAGFPASYTKRIEYVPHGFRLKTSTLSKQEARAKFGLPQDVKLLGTVARLNVLKAQRVSIRALTFDPSWHLALGGQGPDEQNLRNLAKELGVADRTHFTGEMSTEEVGDLLAALDLFVFPSSAETFGLAAVEAANAGLPCVCNSLPVLQEVLQTKLGPCSLFADSEHPETYEEPIRKLLDDQELVQTLKRSSAELKNLYSVDAMVRHYDELIREQLANESILAEAGMVNA